MKPASCSYFITFQETTCVPRTSRHASCALSPTCLCICICMFPSSETPLLSAWLIPIHFSRRRLKCHFPHEASPNPTHPLSFVVSQTTSDQFELGFHTTLNFHLSPKTHCIVVLLLTDSFCLLSSAPRRAGNVLSSSPHPQGLVCGLSVQHMFE